MYHEFWGPSSDVENQSVIGLWPPLTRPAVSEARGWRSDCSGYLVRKFIPIQHINTVIGSAFLKPDSDDFAHGVRLLLRLCVAREVFVIVIDRVVVL